ncbi:hypothetical protein [Desulforapulum autotrophicum]|uniref:hypothetical protein n=1 Tax=Desulforapulum autotrophicum TaxID=2296 RepID=UPI001E62A8E7|nr:hypothetical protein [Desulforapulum autotrophicum]
METLHLVPLSGILRLNVNENFQLDMESATVVCLNFFGEATNTLVDYPAHYHFFTTGETK